MQFRDTKLGRKLWKSPGIVKPVAGSGTGLTKGFIRVYSNPDFRAGFKRTGWRILLLASNRFFCPAS